VLQKVVLPAYFARENMTAPLRYTLIAMALNTVVAAGGAPLMGFLAIPFGTALAAWVNLGLLWRGARGYGAAVAADARLIRAAPRLALAALAMGAALVALASALEGTFADPAGRWLALAVCVLGGAAVYALAAAALGAVRPGDLRAALRRG